MRTILYSNPSNSLEYLLDTKFRTYDRYCLARLDLHESGIIGKASERTSTCYLDF
jgi:hypothetical protein